MVVDGKFRVYIAYAGDVEGSKEKSEEIVKTLKEKLYEYEVVEYKAKQQSGEQYTLDDFIEEIGSGECIIVVVSQKYLTASEYCQLEIKYMMENRKIKDRVFPIFADGFSLDEFYAGGKNRLIKQAHSLIDTHIKNNVSENEREKIKWQSCKNTTEDFISNLAKEVNWAYQSNEIDSLVAKIKSKTHIVEEKLLITNKPNKLSWEYQKDIPREDDLKTMYHYFGQLQDNKVGLMYVHGSAGVGKSSFLTKSFLDCKHKKFIYYIDESDDYSEHLDRISIALSKSFDVIRKQQGLSVSFQDITNIENLSSRIEKLFYVYSHSLYDKTHIPFTLFVDAVDTIRDEEKFIKTLVKSYPGVNFVFSGRKVPSKEFFTQIQLDNKQLDIYSDKAIGLELSNLNRSMTIQYLEENLDNSLVSKEREEIKQKILSKSKGLPKYFELLLSRVNQLIQDSHTVSYANLVAEIDNAPSILTDYYQQIFKRLQEDNPLALEILEILYWYSTSGGISRDILRLHLETKCSEEEFYNTIDSIMFFLQEDENAKLSINHLSIIEALFDFFAKRYNGSLSARRLDIEYMQSVFKKDAILLYLAKYNQEVYELFSSISYYHDTNKLFCTLQKIISFYKNRELKRNENPINLYFLYSKILFTKHMLNDNVLKNDSLTFEIFEVSHKEMKELYSFNEEVYRQYQSSHLDNISTLKKLIFMTLLDQNSYYQSKYFKLYPLYKYTQRYKKIFTNKYLSKHSLYELSTNISRVYVAMRFKLSSWDIDPALGIYEDDGMLMIYFNNSKDIHTNVIHTLTELQKSKKNRDFVTKQERYYNVLKSSTNIKLKKRFYSGLTYNLRKQNSNKHKQSEKLKEFISFVAMDILKSSISSFDREDKMYKYLPSDKKQEVNYFLQLYQNYQNIGLKSILKSKNKPYFSDMAMFIVDDDIEEFFEYVQKCLDEEDKYIFLETIGNIIRYTQDSQVLRYCEDKLEFMFKDYIGEAPLLLKLHIAYKLKDIDKLISYEKYIIDKDYDRENRSFIESVIGSIESNLDKYWDILSTRKISNLKNNLRVYLKKGKYKLKELEFFKNSIKIDEKACESLIESSYSIADIKRLKYIFMFLETNGLLNAKDKQYFLLNMLFIDNQPSFIKHIKKLPKEEQVEFLLKAMSKDRSDIIYTDIFFKYFLEEILSSKIDKNIVDLMKRFYPTEYFYQFATNNPTMIQNVYDSLKADTSEDTLNIKVMLYRNILALQGENSYKELESQEWIPQDKKVEIASTLIYLTKDIEIAKYLLEFANDDIYIFAKMKMQIYIGFIYKLDEYLALGIKNLELYIKEPKRLGNIAYENYLQYTLSYQIDTKLHQWISDIYTSAKHHYFQISFYKNAYSIFGLGSKEIDDIELKELYIENAGEFASFDSLFNELGKELTLEDFEEESVTPKEVIDLFKRIDIENAGEFASFDTVFNELHQRCTSDDLSNVLFQNNFDKYMMVLYDLYKEAESLEDEESYDYYTELFDRLKEKYREFFEERFDDVDSVSLDDYYSKQKTKDSFSIELIKVNYHQFYDYISNLVKQEKFDKFDEIMSEVKNNDEYLQILKDKSSIQSTLKMKYQNIELFEPIDK